MGYEHVVDAEREAIYVKVTGEIDDAELRRGVAAVAADPAFNPGFRILHDYTRVSKLGISTDLILDMATTKYMEPRAKRAFVAASLGVYGVLRMYENATTIGPEGNVAVFNQRNLAVEWLNLGLPDSMRIA